MLNRKLKTTRFLVLNEQPGRPESPAEPGRPPWAARHWAGLALSLIILLAAALRLYVLYKSHFIPDGDEALTGIMAQDILNGARPVFTYGQHYMAATEAYFTAIVYAFFGVSAWGMKVAPFLASLAVVALNYAVARRYLGSKLAGLFAAFLTALPSLYFTVIGLRAWNHSTETILGGTLLLLIAYAILWGPAPDPAAPRFRGYTRREWLLWSLLGLVVGWSFYGHMLAIYYYVPIVFFLFLKDKRFVLRPPALATVLAFFAGSAPWWLYNLANSWATIAQFTKPTADDKKPALDVLDHYAAYSVPLATGAYNYWFTTSIYIGFFLNAICLLTLGGWLAARWRGLAGWFRLSFKPARPVDLLLLLALGSPLIYLLWGAGNVAFTKLDTTGRYLLPLLGIMPVMVGGGLAAAGEWLARQKLFASGYRKYAPPVLAAGLLLAVAASNLFLYRHADFVTTTQSPYFPQLQPPLDNGPLIGYLKNQGIEYATCNHWVGHRIILDSAQAIKCVDYHDLTVGGLDRFPAYTQQILQPGRRVAFVLLNLDVGSTWMERKLNSLNIAYSRQELYPYIVIIPITRPVSPVEVIDEIHYPL